MRHILNIVMGLLFLLILFSYVIVGIAAFFGIQVPLEFIGYAIVIALYAYISLLAWGNVENLALFNLDRATFVLIVIFGILRSRRDIQNEGYYMGVIFAFALVILLACIKNWKNMPKTNWRWAAVGVFACLSVIPISAVESLQPERYTHLYSASDRLGLVLIRRLLEEFSFGAILEETIFRGILWGYLRKLGWRENKIFWGQAILFWLIHIWRIGIPITFFFTIPAGTLIYSLLTRYSKQVFPSIFVHAFLNAVGPLLLYYYLH